MSIQLRRRAVIPRRLTVLGTALLLAVLLALALIPWHANDRDSHDFRVHLGSFLVRTMTANAVSALGGRHNLPDFHRYCYYRGLQSVLQSGVLPTPQERVE